MELVMEIIRAYERMAEYLKQGRAPTVGIT